MRYEVITDYWDKFTDNCNIQELTSNLILKTNTKINRKGMRCKQK